MVKIGLLSDTHGHLDERINRFLLDCDEVWHAGDIGSEAVADQLEHGHHLRAVYGNIDGREIRLRYPESQCFQIEEVKVVMIHIGGYPGRYSARVRDLFEMNRPQLFISGHSHILKVINDPRLSLLHINPGAAGKYGPHLVQTAVRFEIAGKSIQELEVLDLER